MIYADKPPSWRVWRPQRVVIGSHRIRRIACGAWHVLAVTGTPGLYYIYVIFLLYGMTFFKCFI